jgi:hypothetical protein
MQIKAMTVEQFVEIYSLLEEVKEFNPSKTFTAYSGLLPGTGEVVITTDPIQCLLFITK